MSDLAMKPCGDCGAAGNAPCTPRWIGDRHAERSAFAEVWGHTPLSWLQMRCPGCGADLECFDPDAGPMFDEPYCQGCTVKTRCSKCDGPGIVNCPCRGSGLKPEGNVIETACSMCDGAGRVSHIDRPSTNSYECERCRGTGDEPDSGGSPGATPADDRPRPDDAGKA